ncbi:MAG: hypothetical protein E7161_03725 [Firmicutes bacterium]|nr:hypothetical protein [Bacillota bacterium]
MKKKSLFKNQKQMIVYSIIFIACIVLFIVIGQIDFQKDMDTESKKFHSLYSLVEDDNLYVFSNATEVLEILNGRSGVILMGFPTNIWTNYYADILNKVSKEVGIDKIHYYDFQKDRDESNGTYETVVNKLTAYVPVDDNGFQDIQAPTVVIVKNGEIIGYFDDTSIIKGNVTPDIYYTEYQKGLTYEGFKTALLEFIK